MTLRLGDTLIAGSGANQDLSNLTSQGKNIANWSSNVTNCITEVPQDIKVEINSGIFTRKAGSKFYVPNGFDGATPKFDVITQNTDISCPTAGQNLPNFVQVVYPSNINDFHRVQGVACFSGSTAPTGYGTMLWYDTGNNILKLTTDSGSTWTGGFSLPYAITTETSGDGYTSIDQVFNGFGYIGSTVFALPGVKGLIPNGRNDDGSLKNIEVVVNSVNTYTITGWERLDLLLYGNSINAWPSQYSRYTDENFYEVYDTSQSKWVKSPAAVFGFASFNSKITSFTPKTAFHSLDYNDSSTISGWSMPSSRYIDLTLGANNATYTAPANGWVWLDKTATGAQFITLQNVSAAGIRSSSVYYAGGMYLAVILPVKKGDVFAVEYNAAGTLNAFKFIYSEGENV